MKYCPLLCAGVTVFNSLRKQNIVPGSTVAIQGLGGLGHLALQYTSKMGYRTVAISSSDAKKDFAMKLGAHGGFPDHLATAQPLTVSPRLHRWVERRRWGAAPEARWSQLYHLHGSCAAAYSFSTERIGPSREAPHLGRIGTS